MRNLRSLKLPLIIVAAAASLVAVASITGGKVEAPAVPTQASHPADGHDHANDPAHQQPPFVRTLAVHLDSEPGPSAHPERMRALLVDGKLPARPVEATVLTDEDCAADARGVSNCRNELRLPSGRTLAVRHPHRMAEVPCMTPGETVRVRPRGET
jgi:hypothetical protein